MSQLTHLEKNGQAKMVDVGAKGETDREAIAFGEIHLMSQTLRIIQNRESPKGNVLEVARLAGIMAAKKCADLIPLCHPLALNHIDIKFQLGTNLIRIRTRVKTYGKTGVEMEALTGVSVAALTLFDMCKAVDKEMEIGPLYLGKKSGGRSGVYERRHVPEEWFQMDNTQWQ